MYVSIPTKSFSALSVYPCLSLHLLLLTVAYVRLPPLSAWLSCPYMCSSIAIFLQSTLHVVSFHTPLSCFFPGSSPPHFLCFCICLCSDPRCTIITRQFTYLWNISNHPPPLPDYHTTQLHEINPASPKWRLRASNIAASAGVITFQVDVGEVRWGWLLSQVITWLGPRAQLVALTL